MLATTLFVAIVAAVVLALCVDRKRRCPYCGKELPPKSYYCSLCDIVWDAAEVDSVWRL